VATGEQANLRVAQTAAAYLFKIRPQNSAHWSKSRQNEAASFESAYRQAESVLQASPNCPGYELIRSDKDSQNYLLTIFRDSSDGHLEGFRKSDLFPKFLELIRPYIPMIQEMEHYHSTGMS
jgi:quinol monooxygenase YgiN